MLIVQVNVTTLNVIQLCLPERSLVLLFDLASLMQVFGREVRRAREREMAWMEGWDVLYSYVKGIISTGSINTQPLVVSH